MISSNPINLLNYRNPRQVRYQKGSIRFETMFFCIVKGVHCVLYNQPI